MKKILLFIGILGALLCMTGCTSNVNLDLEKIKIDLVELEDEKFEPSQLYQLNISKYFTQSEDFYDMRDYDVENSDIEYMQGVKSTTNDYFYMVIKPVEDKTTDVKNKMQDFFDNLEDDKIKIEEHEGYIIYIYSENSDELLTEIKASKGKVLPALMEIEKDSIETVLNIDEEWVDEFLMMQPLMNVTASQFIIIKPVKGYDDEIKEKIDEYMKSLEEQWERYLPEQYELVKNRLEENFGNYLIYIVSENNELIYDTIKNNEIK